MSLFSVPFTVKRQILINAPVEKVFQQVADLSAMQRWSPWLVMEPNALTKLSGPSGQVGAQHYWQGEIIGEGHMEISALEKNQRIKTELQFLKPWKSTASAEFTFTQKTNNQIEVSWTLHSQLPLFLFWLKSSMTSWVGMDYQRGLSMLKQWCETGEILTNVNITGQSQGEGFHYLGIKNSCPIDQVGPTMAADFEKLESYIKQNQLEILNPAFSIYHQFDLKKQVCTYTSGVATKALLPAPQPFVTGTVKGGKAIAVEHTGPYLNLGNAWSAGYSYLQAKKIKTRRGCDPLEIYTNHPKITAPAELHTVIYFPIK